ncbi:MAG TPA: glycosyltransferase family 4 protein [Vineibacter terrae]|nr:glycosyltransferase family 4 protein [Vineibacter terrae]
MREKMTAKAAAKLDLHNFTPLPPARNGIADYAYKLMDELRALRRCVVYCDDVLAFAPQGVDVRDEAQAFRYVGPHTPILHQIGNNGGHIFVLEALRRHGGIVSLHDLSLLYLYELSSPRLEPILAGMQQQDPALGALYGRQWKENRLKTAANYVLFDMVGEILSLADGIIVHSRYAMNKLRAGYGPAAAAKCTVIPHFAPVLAVTSAEEARQRLSLPPDERIVLTSGFATRSKRFDWLLEALETLLQDGVALRWIHAGEERPDEYPLREELAKHPRLRDVATITGYVSEAELDAYIAAADLVVNLRFPSVGESSGTLARAFSAGRCCIVNDTAAYAEIPREAVVHIPIFDTVPALVRAMEALLHDGELRTLFGDRARHYAGSTLAMRHIAKSYSDFIDATHARTQAAGRQAAERHASPPAPVRVEIDGADALEPADLRRRLSGIEGPFEALFWFDSADDIARYSLDKPGFLQGAFGPHVTIDTVRFRSRPAARGRRAAPEGGSAVGLSVLGRAYGWQ